MRILVLACLLTGCASTEHGYIKFEPNSLQEYCVEHTDQAECKP